MGEIKKLDECFDERQLKILDRSGGNKAFSEFMKEYQKETEKIPVKY